mmetsp:Transcript_61295/g.172858  ORF Transcript_61295/g.172858 Transcript_61295/m.172858 type:complete len:224 (+) Transcript_61295:319-990(+)
MFSLVMEEVRLETKIVAIRNATKRVAMAKTRSRRFCGVISSMPPVNCAQDQCSDSVYSIPTGATWKPFAVIQVRWCPPTLPPRPHQTQAIVCAEATITSTIWTMSSATRSDSEWIFSMKALTLLFSLTTLRSRNIRMTRSERDTRPRRTKSSVPKPLLSMKTSTQSVQTRRKSKQNQDLRYTLAIAACRIFMLPSSWRRPVRNVAGMSQVQKNRVIQAVTTVK